MNITEVHIKLLEPPQAYGRLRAYASVTFDQAFVVHDIKVVQGTERLFVAMPSRRLNIRCTYCHTQNQITCNGRTCIRCEEPLPQPKAIQESDGKAVLDHTGQPTPFVDIFHPINTKGRALIDAAVLHAYQEAIDRQEVTQHVPAL